MPLNYERPTVRNMSISQKVGNILARIIDLIHPETILGVFLIVSILLVFIQIKALGFYIMFGVFIAGYFTERVVKIIRKRNV